MSVTEPDPQDRVQSPGAQEQDPVEVLKARAEALAVEQEPEQHKDLVSLLWFRVGEDRYAVRLEEVREIVQEFAVTSLPCVPPFVLGVTNIRGEILSVCDPAVLMGVGRVEGATGVESSAIVVRSDDRVTALLVDEVGSIIEIERDAIDPPVSSIERGRGEYLAGSSYVDGSVLALLDVDRVLTPIASEGITSLRCDHEVGGRS